jgi:putative ABC transport system permease protein
LSLAQWSQQNRDKNKSLFTRIKTVDEKYPLYGEVVMSLKVHLIEFIKNENTLLINENIFKNFKS